MIRSAGARSRDGIHRADSQAGAMAGEMESA